MSSQDPLVDVGALMALTTELRALADRIESAAVDDDQRGRWQRTLASIAEGATGDIERARGQLRRFSAQVDRALGEG